MGEGMESNRNCFFSEAHFFSWVQLTSSLAGIYLPRLDKCKANFWDEQFATPVQAIIAIIRGQAADATDNTNGDQAAGGCCRCRYQGQGIKWWLGHWFFTRFINLAQLAWFAGSVASFSIFKIKWQHYSYDKSEHR